MHVLRALFALLALPFLMALPAPASAHPYLGSGERCVVSNEDMDMILIREKPTGYAKINKKLNVGECGVVITGGCSNDWCPVRQGEFAGWMRGHNLAPISAPVFCVASTEYGYSLDIHVAPSTRTAVVASLSWDYCGIEVLPFHDGHWQRVRVYGKDGWVNMTSIRAPHRY